MEKSVKLYNGDEVRVGDFVSMRSYSSTPRKVVFIGNSFAVVRLHPVGKYSRGSGDNGREESVEISDLKEWERFDSHASVTKEWIEVAATAAGLDIDADLLWEKIMDIKKGDLPLPSQNTATP